MDSKDWDAIGVTLEKDLQEKQAEMLELIVRQLKIHGTALNKMREVLGILEQRIHNLEAAQGGQDKADA